MRKNCIYFILFLAFAFSLSAKVGSPLECHVTLNTIVTNQRKIAAQLTRLDQDTRNGYQFLFPAEAEGEVARDIFKVFGLPPLPTRAGEAFNASEHFQKIVPKKAIEIRVVVTRGPEVKIYKGQLESIQFKEVYFLRSGFSSVLDRKIEVKQIVLAESTGDSRTLESNVLEGIKIADIRMSPRNVWTTDNARELFERTFSNFKVREEFSPKYRWIPKGQTESNVQSRTLHIPSLTGKKVAILFRRRSMARDCFDYLNQPEFFKGTLLRLERKTYQPDSSFFNFTPYHGFSIVDDKAETHHFGFKEFDNPSELIDILAIRFQ
jgi:hypothetical protein